MKEEGRCNQLLEYMNDLGLDPGSYHDATVLEFDFTPLANKLSSHSFLHQ